MKPNSYWLRLFDWFWIRWNIRKQLTFNRGDKGRDIVSSLTISSTCFNRKKWWGPNETRMEDGLGHPQPSSRNTLVEVAKSTLRWDMMKHETWNKTTSTKTWKFCPVLIFSHFLSDQHHPLGHPSASSSSSAFKLQSTRTGPPETTCHREVNFEFSSVEGVPIRWSAWLGHPSEKWWSSSIGMMKFPIYGKNKNVPNHQPVMCPSKKMRCSYFCVSI